MLHMFKYIKNGPHDPYAIYLIFEMITESDRQIVENTGYDAVWPNDFYQ